MPPGNGQGKPPDWIPPGLRPDAEDGPWDELHGDWFYGLDDGLANDAIPFDSKASGGFYTLKWMDPTSPRLYAQLSPVFTFQPWSNDGSLLSIEVQSCANADFASGVTTTTLTNRTSGANTTATFGPFTNLTTVFFRARAGGGSSWSAWEGPIRLSFNIGMGNAAEHVLLNAGVLTATNGDASESALLNVGVLLIQNDDAAEYILEGDVNTATPQPVIWGIFPTAGREGDGFTIYGHGFGATAGTYSGVAVMEMSPDQNLSVSSWTQVAAGAHAYDSLRELDLSQSPPVITMEHQKIDVTVPTGAVPPGYPVRVDTNGA